jgi:beta-glucosidase
MQYRYEAWIKMGYVAQSVLDDKNKLDQDKITNADAVVLCVGFNSEIEGEGNDRAFELQAKQVALLNRVTAYNKNVIVVLTGGGNMYMKPWINSTGAVLHAWYPGQAGGQAVAEILFGHVNPSGKLPASFEFEWKDNPAFNSYYDADKGGPACNYCNTNNDKRVFYSEGVFTGYRHYDRNNIKPMFPFGYGLSYTSFAYSNISVSKPAFTDNDSLVVTFTITNTGKVFGKEVAQLYVSDKAASVPRPVKELKGFAKVGLKAGESKQVSITVKSNDFKFFDMDLHDWKLEPGDFDILIGSSAEKLELKTTVKAQ